MAANKNNSIKKTKCYGVICLALQNPQLGYVGGRHGDGPFVVFLKRTDDITDPQVNGYSNYVKSGDTVIEYEEVARYIVERGGPRLRKVGEESPAENPQP